MTENAATLLALLDLLALVGIVPGLVLAVAMDFAWGPARLETGPIIVRVPALPGPSRAGSEPRLARSPIVAVVSLPRARKPLRTTDHSAPSALRRDTHDQAPTVGAKPMCVSDRRDATSITSPQIPRLRHVGAIVKGPRQAVSDMTAQSALESWLSLGGVVWHDDRKATTVEVS